MNVQSSLLGVLFSVGFVDRIFSFSIEKTPIFLWSSFLLSTHMIVRFFENDSTVFQMLYDFLRVASRCSFRLAAQLFSRRWQSSSTYDSRDNDLIPPTSCCMSNCANCKWFGFLPNFSDEWSISRSFVSRCVVYLRWRDRSTLSERHDGSDRWCSEEVHRWQEFPGISRIRNPTTINWKEIAISIENSSPCIFQIDIAMLLPVCRARRRTEGFYMVEQQVQCERSSASPFFFICNQ